MAATISCRLPTHGACAHAHCLHAHRLVSVADERGGVCGVCVCDVCYSFFQIELPCYSTDELMATRILAAVNFGMGEFLVA